jgi:hypothetical protein
MGQPASKNREEGGVGVILDTKGVFGRVAHLRDSYPNQHLAVC